MSEASFRHVHGTTSRDLWLSLEKAYAPHFQHLGEYHLSKDTTSENRDASVMKLMMLGSPSMPKARQAQLSELTAQLSTLRFQVSSIVPSGPQAFYGARLSNNNGNNNNNNRVNHNNSRGNNKTKVVVMVVNLIRHLPKTQCMALAIDVDLVHFFHNAQSLTLYNLHRSIPFNFAIYLCSILYASTKLGIRTLEQNSRVTPDLEAIDNFRVINGERRLHVGNVHLHQRSPISFISVSHLSPTSQTSTESSNGQPSPVLTTSSNTTTTTPPPPPPPIIQQWRQAMKEEYDALMKNRMSSLVPHASNTNGVDGKWVYWINGDKNGAITFTNNWPLRQLDVHNAFLHGNLKEQVYMKQPSGFIDPQRPNHGFKFIHYVTPNLRVALLSVSNMSSDVPRYLFRTGKAGDDDDGGVSSGVGDATVRGGLGVSVSMRVPSKASGAFELVSLGGNPRSTNTEVDIV
ncbi:integrase [Tanacetum coccineum]